LTVENHLEPERTRVPRVTDNAKADELNLETGDVARIRKDEIALGKPVKG
jgi:hypothetical protein